MSKLIKWTLEACKADALKYKSKSEWEKNSLGAYTKARRQNWLDQCCGHMKTRDLTKKWTLEACKADALKYKSRAEWEKNGSGCQSARKKGWMDLCCGHMDILHIKNKWTLEICKKEALKHTSRTEWKNKNRFSYHAAKQKKWLDQCCAHMEILGGTSRPEQELQKAIKESAKNQKIKNNALFKLNKSQKIKLNLPHVYRYELDIYIPDLNLGIEFNGTYWHSFEGLKRGRPNWTDEQLKSYHDDKMRYFDSLGIKIAIIDQKDWENSKEKILDEIRTNLYI